MLGEGGRQKENKNGKHWHCSLAIILRERKKTGRLRIWQWEAVGISDRVGLAEEGGSATYSPSYSVGSLESSDSRPAWVTQRDPCFKKKTKKKSNIQHHGS